MHDSQATPRPAEVPDEGGPHAIGIIMDGNRRFARERGKKDIEGHAAGYEKLKEVARWARESGVRELTVYAFSTENWQRSEEEREFLFALLRRALRADIEEFKREGVRLRIIGERERFPQDIRELIISAEEETREGAALTLAIALSYGGRAEILAAARALVASGIAPEEITAAALERCLWTAGMRDPDMILRTGGERRLSNFLPWQSVYSELFFIDTYWPALTREEFEETLAKFAARERRMGR